MKQIHCSHYATNKWIERTEGIANSPSAFNAIFFFNHELGSTIW